MSQRQTVLLRKSHVVPWSRHDTFENTDFILSKDIDIDPGWPTEWAGIAVKGKLTLRNCTIRGEVETFQESWTQRPLSKYAGFYGLKATDGAVLDFEQVHFQNIPRVACWMAGSTGRLVDCSATLVGVGFHWDQSGTQPNSNFHVERMRVWDTWGYEDLPDTPPNQRWGIDGGAYSLTHPHRVGGNGFGGVLQWSRFEDCECVGETHGAKFVGAYGVTLSGGKYHHLVLQGYDRATWNPVTQRYDDSHQLAQNVQDHGARRVEVLHLTINPRLGWRGRLPAALHMNYPNDPPGYSIRHCKIWAFEAPPHQAVQLWGPQHIQFISNDFYRMREETPWIKVGAGSPMIDLSVDNTLWDLMG